MEYFIDTGILLRLFDDSDPHHVSIRTALRTLRRTGNVLCTAYQNIAEFWNVSTRPSASRGGYGHSVASTERRIHFIESFGQLLFESELSYRHWRHFLVSLNLTGVAVHDARLVAIMHASGIARMLTLNPDDFRRYPGITVLTPTDIP